MKSTPLKQLTLFCLLLTCVTLFACTPDKKPQTAALATSKIASSKITEPQRAALDRANAVSEQLQQQAAQQQQQIDQQSN